MLQYKILFISPGITTQNTDKRNFAFFLFLISRPTHTKYAVSDPCVTAHQKDPKTHKRAFRYFKDFILFGEREGKI